MITHKQAILLHLLEFDSCYGRILRSKYKDMTGKTLSTGTEGIYDTLHKLEIDGFLTSEIGTRTHKNGGSHRRYYTITAVGSKALALFVSTVTSSRIA